MITLEKALALIAAGETEARDQGLALAFAVVDDGGHLVALHRMGLPITDDGGAVIGAMGASGGTGQQDEAAVRAALDS